MKKALQAPLTAIIENSGKSASSIIADLKTAKQKTKDNLSGQASWLGFNALDNKIMNLKEAGIIDPLKVVKTAFINAVSVASTYLSVGAAITDLPEKKEKMPGGGMEGMGY